MTDSLSLEAWRQQRAAMDAEFLSGVEICTARADQAQTDKMVSTSQSDMADRYARLIDEAEISPQYFINDLSELTEVERRILCVAVAEPGRTVALTAVVNRYLGGRNPFFKSRKSGQKTVVYGAR